MSSENELLAEIKWLREALEQIFNVSGNRAVVLIARKALDRRTEHQSEDAQAARSAEAF